MAYHAAINATDFPLQDRAWLNKRVVTIMQFDSKRPRLGNVVRADAESPWLTLIQLDDGRFVTHLECSFKLAEEADG